MSTIPTETENDLGLKPITLTETAAKEIKKIIVDQQLPNDEPGLNGLTHPDLIGEQVPLNRVVDDAERRVDLVLMDANTRRYEPRCRH